MSKQRRKFSVDQKLQIVQEADQHGITQTLRKHNLSHSVFLRWKHQFNSGGAGSLKLWYHKVDPEVKALQELNARLKKLIGNHALELEFKTELLKKAGCPRAEIEGLVRDYRVKGIPVRRLLVWSRLGPSSFYYKKSGRPKGLRPSTHSVNSDGEFFENTVVVQDIEKTLHQEFCCYGYRNITGELRDRGWIINHKKVYRLMKEYKLLNSGKIRPGPFKWTFIRFRTPGAERPLPYLSMDIKYVHIHGWNRNVYLLTVMDIYSRNVLIHMLKASKKVTYWSCYR